MKESLSYETLILPSLIIENIEVVQEAIVSINKIFDILDEKQFLEDLTSGIELDKIKGKIEFKNVWFSYSCNKHLLPTLDQIHHLKMIHFESSNYHHSLLSQMTDQYYLKFR